MRFTKFTDTKEEAVRQTLNGQHRKGCGAQGRKKAAAVLAVSISLGAAVSGCGNAVSAGAFEETAVVSENPEIAGTETGDEYDADGAVSANDSIGSEVPEDKTETDSEKERERMKVRGIYVSGPMAGNAGMDKLIELVDETELNALVIDIKNDDGYLTCDLNVPFAEQIGAEKHYIKDVPALVQKCKEKGIYLIARIVAFKDPVLARAVPELSLHKTDGSIFYDKSGLAWVDPYRTEVWDYLVSVGAAAVRIGFDEVQFDYVRFSTDSGMKQVDFSGSAEGRTKTEAITGFTEYASERLRGMGAAVSADVYGVVIDSRVDQEIVGQDYAELCRSLDAISPMVYPSHYGPYNYNIPIPDAQPYDTVLAAMQASRKVLAGLDPKTGLRAAADGTKKDDVSGNDAADGNAEVVEAVSGNDAAGSVGVSENSVPTAMSDEEIAALEPEDGVRASVRPWLQDFTATWVKGHIPYGAAEIRAQIQAVYDAGYEEWILWNAANRYTEEGLYGPDGKPEEPAGAASGMEAAEPIESAVSETTGG